MLPSFQSNSSGINKEVKSCYLINQGNSTVQTISYPDNKITIQNPVCVSDKNGSVYIFFYSEETDISENIFKQIKVLKSTNGGLDFHYFPSINHYEKSVTNVNVIVPTNQSGYTFKENSFHSVAIDLSEKPTANNIYVVWSEYLGESNPNNTSDLFLAKSTNGGNNWQIIGNILGPNNMGEQFFPSVSVDEEGRIHILYYSMTTRNNYIVTPKYLTSLDGGNTFIEDQNFDLVAPEIDFSNTFRVRSSGNNPGFIGDYICVAASSKKIVAVYTAASSSNRINCSNSQFKESEIILASIIFNKIPINIQTYINTNPYSSGYILLDTQQIYNNEQGAFIYEMLEYSLEAPQQYDLGNNLIYSFRDWNTIGDNYNYEIQRPFAFDIGIHNPNNLIIRTNHYPTQPLTVTNYLEGVSNVNYKVKWQAANIEETKYSNNPPYYAFDFDNTQDKYDITAPPAISAFNANWHFLN